MSATERVRELLDERGVEWKEHRHTLAGSMAIQRETLWGQPIDNTNRKPIPHVYHFRATEMGDGRLFLEAQLVTPEQAVDATLGPTATTVDETETWECVCDQIGRYGKRVTVHMMECSECGHTYEHVNGDYEFCPHCGRRIVEVNA